MFPQVSFKEILPAIAKDPNYLSTHNMEWNEGRVRQKPGVKNSLGLVKFLFPTLTLFTCMTPSKYLVEKKSL
jgi:murein L,D-transpeptidase YcbB/YkuD